MRILTQTEQFAYRVAAVPAKLYRGLNLSPYDLTPDHRQRIKAALKGRPDLTLGRDLLGHFSTNRGFNGLGQHWTSAPGAAHYFANGHDEEDEEIEGEYNYVPDPHNIPLVLEAEWSGDPAHRAWQPSEGIWNQDKAEWTGGGDERYDYEHETTLKAGIPMRVTGLYWARNWGQGKPEQGVGSGYKNLLSEPYEGTT